MNNSFKFDSQYLQLVNQRKQYSEHMRHLLEAKPTINTSPFPKCDGIIRAQKELTKIRQFQLQVEMQTQFHLLLE